VHEDCGGAGDFQQRVEADLRWDGHTKVPECWMFNPASRHHSKTHHDGCMRTTVNLDRDVERILRETAVRTHKPFKKVLNETLRAGIEQVSGFGQEVPFVLRSRPMRLRTGHDPAGFNRLADDLEAESFLEFSNPL
jgi:hypothetical protein